MIPIVIRGNLWRVVRAQPGDPLLVDWTGTPRLATSDPRSRTIRISTSTPIAMFDRVLLHEVSHAIMWESGLSDLLAHASGSGTMEELLAWFLESHSIEAIVLTSSALGRGVCVDGTCIGGSNGTHTLQAR